MAPPSAAEAAVPGVSTRPTECADEGRDPGCPCAPPAAIRVVEQWVQEQGGTPAAAPAAPAAAPEALPAGALRVAAQLLHCGTEACVLAHPRLQQHARRHGGLQALTAALASSFKPRGPRDTTDWLSDRDVDRVLEMWGRRFPRFYPCPYAMMDFEEQGQALSTLRLADLAARQFTSLGCVLNTDTSRGPGRHWVALYLDLAAGQVEYFDSVGAPPMRPVVRWMERRRAELRALRGAPGGDPRAVVVTRVRHQRSNTECGLYSLYYIRCRLEGRPPEWFMDRPIPDSVMRDFRKHVFRGS